MENVDGYEIYWTEDTISIAFTDIFGDGAVYTYPTEEMVKIIAALVLAVKAQQAGIV